MGFVTRALSILMNILIPVWTAYAIYSITGENIIFTVIGTLIAISLGAQNPIVLLVLLPIFEYFYSGKLTEFSYVYIGMVLFDSLVVAVAAYSNRNNFYVE